MVKVELFGSGFLQGPIAEFRTVTEARRWAASYGATADWAILYRGSKIVGRHYRDITGDGLRWYAGYQCDDPGRYRWAGVGPFVWGPRLERGRQGRMPR